MGNKTAIELLKEHRKFFDHAGSLGAAIGDIDKARNYSKMIADIDAYLSSPPSERAMEVAMRIYYDCFLMGNVSIHAPAGGATLPTIYRFEVRNEMVSTR